MSVNARKCPPRGGGRGSTRQCLPMPVNARWWGRARFNTSVHAVVCHGVRSGAVQHVNARQCSVNARRRGADAVQHANARQ